MHFLPAGHWSEAPVGDAMEPWQLIWGSERDSYRHLYLIEGSGYTLLAETKHTQSDSENSSDSDDASDHKIALSPKLSQEDDKCKVFLVKTKVRQLTSGNWEVAKDKVNLKCLIISPKRILLQL